jgi:hypothetical protein
MSKNGFSLDYRQVLYLKGVSSCQRTINTILRNYKMTFNRYRQQIIGNYQ